MTHKGKPESVFIAITQPDGNVAVMQFITLVKRNAEDPGCVREATPENITAEITKAKIAFTSWHVIDPLVDIPQDRTHRNAWKSDSDKITIDPVKTAAIDDKRKLDAAVTEALKAQHEALVSSVKASLN